MRAVPAGLCARLSRRTNTTSRTIGSNHGRHSGGFGWADGLGGSRGGPGFAERVAWRLGRRTAVITAAPYGSALLGQVPLPFHDRLFRPVPQGGYRCDVGSGGQVWDARSAGEGGV
ncbi:hypothetical protein GCM10010341_37650 [Streptomyces noursei]|nr:hypothetical protein GCM10010341_37650 [Streptomyces noursei]